VADRGEAIGTVESAARAAELRSDVRPGSRRDVEFGTQRIETDESRRLRESPEWAQDDTVGSRRHKRRRPQAIARGRSGLKRSDSPVLGVSMPPTYLKYFFRCLP
jgi:hypothetical protein